MRPPGRLPHEVRLLGGRWKRTRLAVADMPGLRPTPARVRETLFNWLGQELGGWRVLDAFAGSGALGLEAASRGAAEVDLIERDAGTARALQALVGRLGATGVRVHRDDALAFLARAPRAAYDLVLLDPPFDAGADDAVLAAAAPLVAHAGWLYFESGRRRQDWPPGMTLMRHARAGAVHAHLLRALDSTPATPSPRDPA